MWQWWCVLLFWATSVAASKNLEQDLNSHKALPQFPELVTSNRLVAGVEDDDKQWCQETPWPENPNDEEVSQTIERRVVIILRGESFRNGVPHWSTNDKNAGGQCDPRIRDVQLDCARSVLHLLILPLEERGFGVDLIAAPSNPECVLLDELYSIIAESDDDDGSTHPLRRIVQVNVTSAHQGEGVQNALEALLRHATYELGWGQGRGGAVVSFVGVLLWRFDACPEKDAGIIFGAAGEHVKKVLVASQVMDHAYWLPWPAMSCFYAAVHNDWPEIQAHCVMDDDGPDPEEEEPGCLQVACFSRDPKTNTGHQCTEALQERIQNWEKRIGLFDAHKDFASHYDAWTASNSALLSPEGKEARKWTRWWKLTRELGGPRHRGDELR